MVTGPVSQEECHLQKHETSRWRKWRLSPKMVLFVPSRIKLAGKGGLRVRSLSNDKEELQGWTLVFKNLPVLSPPHHQDSMYTAHPHPT